MPELTRRQKQVLEALMKGYTNEQIAASVGISRITVEYHLSNIYEKLNLSNKTRLNAALYYMGEMLKQLAMAHAA
jgi:two-component system, NarL family, nitrate/nitrite response regulator NarP